jgi:hypothetical protein
MFREYNNFTVHQLLTKAFRKRNLVFLFTRDLCEQKYSRATNSGLNGNKKRCGSFKTWVSKSGPVGRMRPYRFYYATRGQICNLYEGYKITQIFRRIHISLINIFHLQPAKQHKIKGVAIFL